MTPAFSLSHSRIYELSGRVLDTKTLIPLCANDVLIHILVYRTSRAWYKARCAPVAPDGAGSENFDRKK